MIGHDYPCMMVRPVTVVMHDGFGENVASGGIGEEARARSRVEPFLQPPGKTMVILPPDFVGPWQRMMAFPKDKVLLPFQQFFAWHGIFEPESDELHHLALLPMGKQTPMAFDFGAGIEEIRHSRRLAAREMFWQAKAVIAGSEEAQSCGCGEGGEGGFRIRRAYAATTGLSWLRTG